VEPIHADRDEAAVKPRQRGLDEPPRRDLGSIRDGVLQVEDDAIGAERGDLVELARLIAGREEQAPKQQRRGVAHTMPCFASAARSSRVRPRRPQ
jgi:hypothetical protein